MSNASEKNFSLLLLAVLIAAGAGIVEGLISSSYLPLSTSIPLLFLAPGIIYGYTTGLYLTFIQPTNERISKGKTLWNWVKASFISWIVGWCATAVVGAPLGAFNWWSGNVSAEIPGTIIAASTGGLVGALILAQAFSRIFKKIDFRIKLSIGFFGLLFAGFFYGYGNTNNVLPFISLFIAWQAMITGLFAYYLLKFNSLWKRTLISVFSILIIVFILYQIFSQTFCYYYYNCPLFPGTLIY